MQKIGLSGEGTDAVVILEKTPFQEEKIPDLLKKPMNAELQMHNDIYCTFYLSPPPELSGECPQPRSGVLVRLSVSCCRLWMWYSWDPSPLLGVGSCRKPGCVLTVLLFSYSVHENTPQRSIILPLSVLHVLRQIF